MTESLSFVIARQVFCSKARLGNMAIFVFLWQKLVQDRLTPSSLEKFGARKARRTWEKRETFSHWVGTRKEA